jgi:hypothetical protein
MPVMGITAVGKDMVRDAKYFRLACRIIAELGAQYVKTYYVEEDFETVTASCPVPIVMAGGKKLPELEALTMAYNAVQQGAAGVDMGRNIFQSDAPKAMIAAVNAVVHKKAKPAEALDLYKSLRQGVESHDHVTSQRDVSRTLLKKSQRAGPMRRTNRATAGAGRDPVGARGVKSGLANPLTPMGARPVRDTSRDRNRSTRCQ